MKRRTRPWSQIIPALIVLALFGSVGIFASLRENRQIKEAARQAAIEAEREAVYNEIMSILGTEGYKCDISAEKAVTFMKEDSKEGFKKKYIPEEYIAETPEEVRYIIYINSNLIEVGVYTDLQKAYKIQYDISIVDLNSGEKIASETFLGSDPPSKVSSKYESRTGSLPSEKVIADWILSVLEEPAEMLLPTEEDQAALKKAVSYLKNHIESTPADLSENLEYEGFSADSITYAIANCGIDWNARAVLFAQIWLENYGGYSQKALIELFMEYKGFTKEQATYGTENCGADWNVQAVLSTQSWLESTEGYSKKDLIDILVEIEGFTEEQAMYGAENCDADWNTEALKRAKDHMIYVGADATRENIIADLTYIYGFTKEQAVYAVDKLGLK